MPEFVYAGQLPRSYTELRDKNGEIVGTVEHGARRDLAEVPPDGLWLEGGTQIAPAWEGVSADMYRLPESREDEPDEDDDSAEAANSAPAPTGRVTAARASLAGAASGSQPDTSTAAGSGQEDE